MNETSVLEARVREQMGSKTAARVRKEGRIPAVVYGHKEEPVSISLDTHDFVEAVHHGQRLLDVKIGPEPQKLLIKELQYDYLGKDIIHVDLMRVDVTEIIEVRVPIEYKGVAKGTQEGGVVEMHAAHILVKCLAISIPGSLVVSIKELALDGAIYAREIKLPEGVTLASPADTLLVACREQIEVKTTEEVTAEAPAAPEVIAKGKAEEEEGGEAAPEQKEKKA
jgi:large subunit ribosomal protein L25